MIVIANNARHLADLPAAVPPADRDTLRDLGLQIAEIAADPIHQETAEGWRRVNDLEPGRPMVLIDESPWVEFTAEEGMALQCADTACRRIEWGLRRLLYQWRHHPADMVVDGTLAAPYAWDSTGCGIHWGEGAISSHADRGAKGFVASLDSLDDVEKMKNPVITADWPAAERLFDQLASLFDGVLPVAWRGIGHDWFAAWDQIVQKYGITKLYTDMTDNPDLVRAVIARYVEAMHSQLDQWEALGLLTAVDFNHRIGSNGLGFTQSLPAPGGNALHARPIDQWGTATGQIFSEVSPAMHEEFCLQYERPYIERFGLSSYGCCEPLHNRIDMVRSIKNLRMISVSPFADVARSAEQIRDDYVFCFKPNPAYLAGEHWNPDIVRHEIEDLLAKTQGCHVTIILKDIHTVRNEPWRLREWNKVAREVVAEKARV